jgi:DNA-binding NtrC family response regulator
VRELRNVMERALILSGGGAIQPLHLPKEIAAGAAASIAPIAQEGALLSLDEIEKRHIRRVMEACGGNKTRAAKVLGITRLTLRTKIADYGWTEFLGSAE